MVYISVKTIIITLLSIISNVFGQTYTDDYRYNSNIQQYTRKISLKQGVLQGIVVEPNMNHALPPVEQYLGIPYAAPPVGELRFMPPGSAPSWYGTKYVDKMGPVCPQKFPNTNNMEASRKDYFSRLLPYLLNQSEDCLYLNIYAPVQDQQRPYGMKYPVMVFIHGESFEWNSGNPYDGSVLAGYGKVIVVTLNFRLGILGFLKVGLEGTSRSNFGLVDQVAALLWVKQNIAAFGGDPNSVTLYGHGTGAACISFLMLSPMVATEPPLFHRAILMSGTALSDWALAGTSRQVTYQVAEALNCPTDDQKLAACLRKKRLNEILSAAASTAAFMTRFGPIVDGLVIPNDPKKIMSSYNDFFRRYELMYGVTEVESSHLLGPVALTHGLLEKERDQELKKYFHARCEFKPELCIARTLAEYTGSEFTLDDQMHGGFNGHEPDRASVARDTLLDMLSDARSAAPLVMMARYHAAVNPQSYFYVFGHTTASREFIRNKTTHGEELPYVFGVPLDGPKFHFVDRYNNMERLYSEVVMTLWCNFAYSGDPNVKRRNDYMTMSPPDWAQFDIDWPEFDIKHERYLYLGIPPYIEKHYRSKEMNYWNELLPDLLTNQTNNMQFYAKPPKQIEPLPNPRFPTKTVPPWFNRQHSNPYNPGINSGTSSDPSDRFGKIKYKPEGTPPSQAMSGFGIMVTAPPPIIKSYTAMNVLIIAGGIFLLVNMILFIGLYYKCTRLKTRENNQKRVYEDAADPHEGSSEKRKKLEIDELENGCSIMKMISKSSHKSGDTYEAVKLSEGGSSKYKLKRQMSASTIDPHTKVRDWIAQEIIQRCSPKFLRRPRVEVPNEPMNNIPKVIQNNSIEKSHIRSDSKTTESFSTLGNSPTRPVSPCENGNEKPNNQMKPVLKKAEKVSIGIDATPGTRGPSVLRQLPIELTKSLDCPDFQFEKDMPLRRSATFDNFLESRLPDLRNCSPSLDRKLENCAEPMIVKIEHHHSKSHSEPIQDLYGGAIYSNPNKKLKSFDPDCDINVTSREEEDALTPLSPEESLMTIKRRNFPKVLPDFPDKQYLAQKRRSMPAASQLFMTIPENPSLSQPNSPTNKAQRFAPAPPPRGCSTLGRRPNNTSIIQSPAVLAEEPPKPNEPEITCNNLFVGPLIPTKENKKTDSPYTSKDEYMLNTQPIYDNLRNAKDVEENKIIKSPKTVITTDPNNPIKRMEPKIIIKPSMSRNTGDSNRSKGIPRVVAKDNVSEIKPKLVRQESKDCIDVTAYASSDESNKPTVKVKTPSLIPKLVKNISKEYSSESSPSEESETGTVIKRV